MNKSERKQAFLLYLKSHCIGKENAVLAKNAREFGTDRWLRRLVHEYRLNGEPICAGDNGYFYAATDEELQGFIRYLSSSAAEIQIVVTALHQGFSKIKELTPVEKM